MIPIPFSRKDASALASKAAWRFQRSMWAVAPHNYAPLHSIDPHGTFRMPEGLSKHDEAVLHRVRLNVAYTNYFRFKTKQAASPLCTLCDVREDLNHVLCECTRYRAARTSLLVSLGLPLSRGLTLSDVLGPWTNSKRASRATKALLSFLRSTGLDQTL